MKEKNKIYTIIAFSIIAILLLSFVLMSYQQPSKNEKGVIMGKLEFPRDEGSHEDIKEFHAFYFNGSGGGGIYYSGAAIWTSYRINLQKYNTFQIYLSKNGKLIYSESYKNFKQTDSSNKSLDIEWVSENGGIIQFKRESPSTDMEHAEYSLQFVNENSHFKLNLHISSQRNITLFGLDGYADMGILGLLKGYVQPQMLVSGTVLFNEDKIYIDGTSMYTHLWGYLPTDHVVFSSLLMKNEDKTIFFFRTYLNKTDPAWEYFYVIGHERYTVFITHYNKNIGASTIGKSVDRYYRIEDLKGASYDAYITDYFPEPADRSSRRCYPNHWFMKSYYDDYSCICHPSDYNSSEKRTWDGFMTGKDSDNRSMWGFSRVYTYYLAGINIKNISFDERNGTINVSANISSSFNLKHVVIEYKFNISGIWENNTGEMEKADGKWVISFKVPDGASSVKVKVHAEDSCGFWKISEEREYIISG